MAFEIVNRVYNTLSHEDPKKYGYVEGYTSSSAMGTYLRMNIKSIPDEEQIAFYDRNRKTTLRDYELGRPYGEGMLLDRKQVLKLIIELFRWLVRGY